MRKVIDTNALRSELLLDFLSRQPTNIAVLPDYSAIEAYNSDPKVGLPKSLEILSHFPRQVLILKGTRAVCAIKPNMKGLIRRLIDQKTTRDRKLPRQVDSA